MPHRVIGLWTSAACRVAVRAGEREAASDETGFDVEVGTRAVGEAACYLGRCGAIDLVARRHWLRDAALA